MGFDRRFTLGLVAWIGALLIFVAAFLLSFSVPGLAAARLLAGLAVAGVVCSWRRFASGM
jgi:two-component system, NtrC family, nitrogen regulation sensor histidine kinase NtrY